MLTLKEAQQILFALPRPRDPWLPITQKDQDGYTFTVENADGYTLYDILVGDKVVYSQDQDGAEQVTRTAFK